MYFKKIFFSLFLVVLSKNVFASPWIEGNKLVIQGLDKITARIETFEVFVGQNHKFGVLDIFVERCVFSKPIFKPESLAFIRINDNSDRFSEVKFKGWMFASSPALNALENSVYDLSILACKNVNTVSKKSSFVNVEE
ncbi:DUF2155 domain-containing protein [Pseudomonadota bacterium]|nr:DUF2155 domain-containing protein [Alphaproteobacteria bacterium]MDC1355983.1 DUF2155 domain-containing protein [Pseudomonadota bacterium]